MISVIEICVAISVISVTLILLELLYEVHKEIRTGNFEWHFGKDKTAIPLSWLIDNYRGTNAVDIWVVVERWLKEHEIT